MAPALSARRSNEPSWRDTVGYQKLHPGTARSIILTGTSNRAKPYQTSSSTTTRMKPEGTTAVSGSTTLIWRLVGAGSQSIIDPKGSRWRREPRFLPPKQPLADARALDASCPKADPHGVVQQRPSRVGSCHSLSQHE